MPRYAEAASKIVMQSSVHSACRLPFDKARLLSHLVLSDFKFKLLVRSAVRNGLLCGYLQLNGPYQEQAPSAPLRSSCSMKVAGLSPAESASLLLLRRNLSYSVEMSRNLRCAIRGVQCSPCQTESFHLSRSECHQPRLIYLNLAPPPQIFSETTQTNLANKRATLCLRGLGTNTLVYWVAQ